MDQRTISKFTDSKDHSNLKGGQDESVQAGDLVLKPVYEHAKYEWLAKALNQLQFDGIKIALPVRSKGGKFIEDSYGATKYFEGEFYNDRLIDKINACRLLNTIIGSVRKPALFEQWQNPWTNAQDLAWRESSTFTIFAGEIASNLDQLLRLRRPLELQPQLIHQDLAGNILFDGNNIPIIIDFTPGYFPKEYAEILLIADSIAWYGASLDTLSSLEMDETIKDQLLLRALIFRLSVGCFRHRSDMQLQEFKKEYKAYGKLLEIFNNR